ncbi:unnamed protein product [Durusdinium trenchii]|uniref:Uncharacterized protein n=2 Tax=Durusdinium trenchii TaxID=1381693 RepID=A0ABP0LD43_9DINO
MVVNLTARDRAIAAHAAAARSGKESPLVEFAPRTPVPSRPSSAKRSTRPSSATTTGTAATARTTGTTGSRGSGRTTPGRSPWGVNFLMPRSFVEIGAKQNIEQLERQLGPKEVKFKELGAKLEADALEAAALEAVLARDGRERRRKAEQACRDNRNSTGEPWRHGRHGQGEGACGARHLPSHRGRIGLNAGGFFSPVSPLEASESALRRSELRTRPASAQLSRSNPSRLT